MTADSILTQWPRRGRNYSSTDSSAILAGFLEIIPFFLDSQWVRIDHRANLRVWDTVSVTVRLLTLTVWVTLSGWLPADLEREFLVRDPDSAVTSLCKWSSDTCTAELERSLAIELESHAWWMDGPWWIHGDGWDINSCYSKDTIKSIWISIWR